MARRSSGPIPDSPSHGRVHFQSVFVFITFNSYQELDSFHGTYFSCRPGRPSNHSTLSPSLLPLLYVSHFPYGRLVVQFPTYPLFLSSMILYGKSHKEGSTVQHLLIHAPPGSWPATPSARFSGSFSSKLSQGRPYFSVRVASENIHSWIEQLNPTMNVLCASALLRDSWIWVCLGT